MKEKKRKRRHEFTERQKKVNNVDIHVVQFDNT